MSYRPMWDCAADRCAHTVNDGHLERVSPKGGPFVGLCPSHYGRTAVLLKPDAAELLRRERSA